MAKLYFLGGENIVKRNARDINASAFQDAGGTPTVLVFPWARASFDKTYKRRKRLFDYFRSLGASTVDFAEYSDTPQEIAMKAKNSDLIYLTGGLTTVLLERLKNKNVDRLLHRYNRVIVGRSAGALALCRRGILTSKNKQTHKIITGLGLVEFTVKVHYAPSEDTELQRLSAEEKIYAISERSALVYDNGALSFMGNVLLFQNGEKTQVD
ncbi:Type 1 glutamine amidotransferase-like domain-containing protein [Candidatus Bathyarchaeota archaeon]|nr:Type 1 glutamine amidotransferase-like domain-containing protein [Candidatus Bathyarchaeota archaeon]